MRFLLCCCLSGALVACDKGVEDGELNIAVIGEDGALLDREPPLGPGAKHLLAASAEGLVALNPSGQVIPAIAQRWIVTDDALSYIFRLRDSNWADGEPIRAEEVEQALAARIRELEGTALGLDLAKITEIRAMTGQIVEVRLSSPMPEFLRLLAQPELGIARQGSGVGPMIVSQDEETSIMRLNALSPAERGLPDPPEDRDSSSRMLALRTMSARDAMDQFGSGLIDLVIGGTIADFPMAQLGPLSRGTIQVDPALGLFGLAFTRETDLLSDPRRREALSMAIDRAELIAPFGLEGWQPTTWIVPQRLFSPIQYPATRWSGLTVEERRSEARGRILRWEAASGNAARLTVALPEGPGGDLLFRQLSQAWDLIGVEAVRLAAEADADLQLRDLSARYSSPRWYLNRFNCTLNLGLCSEEADALVRESLVQLSPEIKQSLLADAHFELVEQEVFIPLGGPVRWALVRGAVSGYQPNPWALHPLFALSQPTI